MGENLLYFTELVSMPVFDLKGRRIGRVKDAAVVPLIHPARIDRILVGGADTWLSIRYDQVRSIRLGEGIELNDEQLIPYHDDEYMLRIARDLLDQQIIDVNGRKVVRVNDLTLEIQREEGRDTLAVAEVDIGLRSIFRRLVQGVLPPRWIRRLQRRIPPNSIPWDFANVVEPDPLRRLRLNISYQRLEQLHPADLADIVEDLSPAEREAIFETIDSEVAADALTEVDPKMQARILESLEPEKAADIVEEMAPDEAADVLSELQEETSEEILDEMASAPKTEVRELLEFEEDTAGGLMNTEYVALHENATVQDAFGALRGNEDLLESLNTVFLVDPDERLVGSVPLARLFIASEGDRLKDLVSEPVIQVSVDERQDRITELFDKYNLLTLPVIDEDGKLAGVITADDIISVLRQK
ncbi:MAG TPA: CBS domain-containing protein [Bryobacteraceae bacterium]|jgi:CBS domain-containing protein/sporulation protein YlmC with PRC-barrel domain|nr:CBS domain-containing protein [Bryobacteraceae bacterium]